MDLPENLGIMLLEERDRTEKSETWLLGYNIGFYMPRLLPPSTAREFVDGFFRGKVARYDYEAERRA